ncbi:hypothetical protein [Amycolatopsis sp. CA-230715]|uniref:hypothetical protein n=1 Tax=Amycolatopsis sp. CA-230715 TaxID=2745196 RepID=UPI001C027019|nr:hypothetical protein [Amycolatopsis sp. CA-230715]
MTSLHLYTNDHINGIVGSPAIPMAVFAAAPVDDLLRHYWFGQPEATLSGVVCGHCSDVVNDRMVRHASVNHIRACFDAGEEARAQAEAERAVDRSVERSFEDRGCWDTREQEQVEWSLGIPPY